MSSSVDFPAVNTLKNLTDKERNEYETKYDWWSKTLIIYRRVHPHSLLDQPRGHEWDDVLQAGLQETPPFYKCKFWRGSLQPMATRNKTDLWNLKALNDSRTSAPLPQPKPVPAPKQKQKSNANASANGSKKAATSKPPAKSTTSSGVQKRATANGSKKAVASKSPAQGKASSSGIQKGAVATASTSSSSRPETRATAAAKRSLRAASIKFVEPSPPPYSYAGPHSQFSDSESDTASQGTVEGYRSRSVRSDAPEPDAARRALSVQHERPVCYEEAATALILISLRHGHNINSCSDRLAACQDFKRQCLEAYRWSPEAQS
ncbi:hypothetical protein BP5796_03870 [Coleophoma crateriformis]|uniref:Uncharacterized protein n=1 Tax=Coleophoma crateriformis TaxID=565419 RepID=A0A3D8SGS2_9HELO|nr:hypothetical protein BP5796_03870 [Coleophoma crateriformis]